MPGVRGVAYTKHMTYSQLQADLHTLERRLARIQKTHILQDKVMDLCEQAYVGGFFLAARDSGQLLEDIAWSDLDSDFRRVIHKQATLFARGLVK